MPGSHVMVVLMLIVMLIVIGLLLSAIAVLAMAIGLLRPPRMTDGKAVWVLKRLSPGDLGLRFEDVWFNIRDEQTGRLLRLAAWWIPHPAADGHCVVLLHGYADAKVGAIAWAPLCHSLGFHILALDLRADGESGGVHGTGGYRERHDVRQVINQLRAGRPGETRQIILFGISVGAAIAAATAVPEDDTTAPGDEIAALVLESPPADFRSAAMAHFDRLGAPGWPFQTLAVSLAEWIAGCDFSSVRPIDTIREVRCPVMIISPDSDATVSASDRRRLEQSLHARGRADEDVFWNVESGHVTALHAEPGDYERRLRQFLVEISRKRVAANSRSP